MIPILKNQAILKEKKIKKVIITHSALIILLNKLFILKKHLFGNNISQKIILIKFLKNSKNLIDPEKLAKKKMM